MRARDIPAILLALASLVTATAGLVKVLRVEKAEERTYQGAAETAGDQASELEELKARVAELEKRK